MILFGHRFIPSVTFYHILDIDSITNTPPSSIIHIEFSQNNLDIINHAKVNQMTLSICCKTITEIIYASSLGASFIVIKNDLAEQANKIANDYLFDAKILVLIEEENEIENLALLGVDGVIFSNAILKVNL